MSPRLTVLVLGAIGTLIGWVCFAIALLPWLAAGPMLRNDSGLRWLMAGFSLLWLVLAILAPLRVIGRLRPWVEARGRLQWQRQLEDGWRAIASDPSLAHWLPLSRRTHVTAPVILRQWEARYQQLLADPRRQAHAAGCLQGRFPSDDEIDYADDPGMTRCCAHLRGVERALRDGGYRCGPRLAAAIWVEARVDDLAALRARFGLDDAIGFEHIERGPHQGEAQQLACARCGSFIEFQMGPPFPR